MKKIIAFVLLAAMALSLAACGTINEKEVAVLWCDSDTAQIPNSLINAMDRAMYIQNIKYTYYGAQDDEATQLQQAQTALDEGCSALMVELVDNDTAQEFIDLAKEKDVPIIFFGCDVDEAVIAGYDKCVLVRTDDSTLAKVMEDMITEYVKNNGEKLDRNSDGIISTVDWSRRALSIKDDKLTIEMLNDVDDPIEPDVAEMIILDNDLDAQELLVRLQIKGYNTDKLVTHFAAIFTVGNEADYKAYVLQDAPTDEDALKAYYEKNKYLVDLTTVEVEDLEEMIYTTTNVVDAGRIAGTAVEDYDAIAVAAAEACATLLTGKSVESAIIPIDYSPYTG